MVPADNANPYEFYDMPAWQRQFAKPVGTIGSLVGCLMAMKNRKLQDFAVEILDIQPDDRVLEIGFGPGVALRMIAAKAWRGFVTGVEVSDVMISQASRRNRRAIREGRLELKLASVSMLPYEDGTFTKVAAINAFQFWPNPYADLVEVKRVIATGGLLVICLRTAHPKPGKLTAPGFTESEVEGIVRLVKSVGFRDVGTARRKYGRDLACVHGKA
jgi:ubiquinone/menaquinone biosynthesis C-methylase UbiE